MIRIIIAEDEQIVAKDIGRRLEKLGYQVIARLKTGQEVLEKAAEEETDLVLMDVKLDGEMDGVETAEKLRELYDVRVIYLTAYADKLTMSRIRKTHPYGYILKPYTVRDLQSNIEAAVRVIEAGRKKS